MIVLNGTLYNKLKSEGIGRMLLTHFLIEKDTVFLGSFAHIQTD